MSRSALFALALAAALAFPRIAVADDHAAHLPLGDPARKDRTVAQGDRGEGCGSLLPVLPSPAPESYRTVKRRTVCERTRPPSSNLARAKTRPERTAPPAARRPSHR
jgi:hypothetical protein